MNRPQVNSESQKELDKAEKQLDAFESNVKSLTMDRLNESPRADVEKQTQLSQNQKANSKDIYLKPEKTIGTSQKFNERLREKYEFAKQYVHFIAENRELVGDAIEIWTRPFGGLPAEFWKVPVNKPVWGPRYLAEQIKRKYYHRLKMDEHTIVSADHNAKYTGAMVVDTTVQRLDAYPVNSGRSVFLGA